MDQRSARTRRRAATAATAACAAALALGVAGGCSQPDPSADFDIPSSPAQTPSPLAAAIPAATTPADNGADADATPSTVAETETTGEPFTTDGAATDGTTVDGAAWPAGAAGAARCTGAGLTVRLGTPTQVTTLAPGLTQLAFMITFTNGTPRTCAMYGFPGATLVTAAGDSYDLPRRTTAMPASLRLPPGGGAAAVLTYLAAPAPQATPPAGDAPPAEAMPVFDARYLLVTPPDDRDPVRIDWPGGPVADQRREAYPGSYIGPVTR
ncbi:DUF4232 domain-containing protein [Pseudofrankia sp. BMG5.36]|uniref:DUF4232 domain-containing protein n=1 Tax=Pseudofrankia sp. BMG5.36 TaxID=1834512 RepID=UPI0008D9BF54|nr:DUF4232 domain-containing protein [Pseudofrankia sp. BMG5.36]OHV47864.1 hypothetical protein BCD48_17055 [Pseudofrankia sp. BMG5.36]